MDDEELAYIIDAVEFVAEQGHYFLAEYHFDLHTGAWLHKRDCVCLEPFSLAAALACCGPAPTALSVAERARRYAGYMREAEALAARLAEQPAGPDLALEPELEALRFFAVPASSAPVAEAPHEEGA